MPDLVSACHPIRIANPDAAEADIRADVAKAAGNNRVDRFVTDQEEQKHVCASSRFGFFISAIRDEHLGRSRSR